MGDQGDTSSRKYFSEQETDNHVIPDAVLLNQGHALVSNRKGKIMPVIIIAGSNKVTASLSKKRKLCLVANIRNYRLENLHVMCSKMKR